MRTKVRFEGGRLLKPDSSGLENTAMSSWDVKLLVNLESGIQVIDLKIREGRRDEAGLDWHVICAMLSHSVNENYKAFS